MFDSWNFAFIFHGVAFGIFPTVSLLYFIGFLNGSLFDFGVMSALATLFSVLSSIYAGKLPERFGRVKPFIIVSFLLSSVLLFFLSQVKDIILFQVLYILLEGSNAIYIPSIRIFVAETYNRNDWSKMFARHSLVVGVAGAFGLALCSLFVQNVGYQTLLFICAPLVFLSFIVTLVVVKDPSFYVERWLSRISRSIDDVETLSYWFGSKGYNLKTRVNMLFFSVGTVLFTIASSSVFSSLPVFFNDVILMSSSLIFKIFMFRSLFGSFSYVIIEKVLGRFREGNAVKLAALARSILVISLFFLAFVPLWAPVLAVVLLSAVAFSWSFYSIDRSTIIIDHSTEGSIGFHGALTRIGLVFGCLLSGVIPMFLGFNLLFFVGSIFFLGSFLFFWKSIS